MTRAPPSRAAFVASSVCNAVQLVLAIIFVFVLVGLISPSFDRRQQVGISAIAVSLAAAQFFFSRFL